MHKQLRIKKDHLAVHIDEDRLDKREAATELLLLRRPILRRLDQRLDEERVLCDPRGHGEDALGDAHLPQERIVGALLHELLEPPVRLQLLLVDRHRVKVLRAKRSVRRTPPDKEGEVQVERLGIIFGGERST